MEFSEIVVSEIPSSLPQVETGVWDVGLAQASLLHYRFQRVDYLPQMFAYRFLIMSREPSAVASYETLVMPFTPRMWALIAAAVIALIAVTAVTTLSSTNRLERFDSRFLRFYLRRSRRS